MSMLRQNQYTSQDAVQHDEGLRLYMLGIYNHMTYALVITALAAMATVHTGFVELFYNVTADGRMAGVTGLGYVAMFAPLILVFFLGAKLMSLELRTAKLAFFGYSALMGISLSSILLLYTGESVIRTLFVTAGAFAGLSLVGYTTKKDLSGMGSFLIMGVFGLIIASVVNMFMQSSAMHFMISVLGVGIFSGLIAYDTQKLRRMYYELGGNAEMAGKVAIMGALTLYLDFINLFIMLMRLIGDRR